MVDPWYAAGALAIAFAITLSLRALPFAILKPLRKSKLVMALGLWMPVGILGILAASTFVDTASVDWATAIKAVIAVAVTVAVHLLGGRRTLLSIGLGTLTFVALVNFF